MSTQSSQEILSEELNFSDKAKKVFGKLVIDKRRLPASQLQKRGIPAYVGEWILDSIVSGDGELSQEEAAKVQQWADKYIPGPGDANYIKNKLYDGELVKVLTPVQVEVILRRKHKDKAAIMSLLGIDDAHIPDTFVSRYPDLLKQGMWGVAQIVSSENGVVLDSFQPMQASVNLSLYKEARSEFSLREWRDLILNSMGYNPSAFTEVEQTILLARLLPLVQKNMHLMELAPKGTGKSYVYENVSPRVRLVSGGNISPAVLFVNNATGQWGLLARYSTVVLDEVQTLKFQKPEEIIGGLKGYLANGRLTRGGLKETASDCSLIMLANIVLDSQQQPMVEPLVKELPDFLQETAFLDRIRGLIPGWRLRKLSGECFSQSLGLKSDFFGDALVALRDDLEHDQYCARRIQLIGERVYKRNEDAVRMIASGMMKILFPHGRLSDMEFDHYCVRPAKQYRQLIWDQLQILDAEYRQYGREIRYEIVPDQNT